MKSQSLAYITVSTSPDDGRIHFQLQIHSLCELLPLGQLKLRHLSNKSKVIAEMEMAHFHIGLKDLLNIPGEVHKMDPNGSSL